MSNKITKSQLQNDKQKSKNTHDEVDEILKYTKIPDKLPTTPEEYKKQITQILRRKLIAQKKEYFFSAPIPPPVLLKEYKDIQPDFPDRILKMAEAQSKHEQLIDKKQLNNINREVHIGQLFGFLIGIFAIAAGAYTAINGAEITGGFIGTSGVIGLVSVFVIGSKRKQKDD